MNTAVMLFLVFIVSGAAVAAAAVDCSSKNVTVLYPLVTEMRLQLMFEALIGKNSAQLTKRRWLSRLRNAMAKVPKG